MSSSLAFRRRLFHLCSLLFSAVYGRVPLLGRLRSAAALIERDGRWLVLDRSDRRGWCFPGGMAKFRESDEEAVRREVEEETGLRITTLRPLFRYPDDHNFPSWVAVFSAEAEGELRPSWEGEPAWLPLAEIAPVFSTQQVIVDYLRQYHAS